MNNSTVGIKSKIKRKLIFDVDTGSDDAIAIMMAHLSHCFEIVAVCSVNGNHAIEFTTENTIRLCEFLNMGCPVYQGCALPMVSTLLPYRRPTIPITETYPMDAHGLYLDLPKAKHTQTEDISAVEFYIKYLQKVEEPITIVAVGPLTNLGLALRICPDISKNIQEIVIMGGGYQECNCDPGAAEWNIWIDPEAAHIVFHYGAPITMMPIDATHQALVTLDESHELAESGSKSALAASQMIDRRIAAYNYGQPMTIPDSAPIHDALCTAYLLDPSVITKAEFLYMDVSCSPDASDGATIAADNAMTESLYSPNIQVCLGCDRKKFVAMLTEICSRKTEDEQEEK